MQFRAGTSGLSDLIGNLYDLIGKLYEWNSLMNFMGLKTYLLSYYSQLNI